MSWGMTGQAPCLNNRWDKPAQNMNNASSNCAASASAQTADGTGSAGGVEKAAAMAAKINAMLMAKGKLLTPPPLLAKKPPVVSIPIVEEMVVTEVDINDVPINSRDLLTKGKTQEEIRQFSGAVVTTKGHYMSDVEKGKVAGQRPLYLQVQGKTQEQVNKAVMKIKEIISEDVLRASAASGMPPPVVPPLTLYPQPTRPAISPVPVPVVGHRPAAPHAGSFVHTKLFVGLDHALPTFKVKEKVEGPSGAYLGHIQTETGARVFLRGKGSGYIEQASKRESFEPLYVYISHPNTEGLEAAKRLTENLLGTVRAEHARVTAAFPVAGPAPAFASHGYPPNSNYSNQGSWYNYPANGYAGSYPAAATAAAYPVGYWSNASAAPSQSKLSTTAPSPQAMVQYPVCPRAPQPYTTQVPGVDDKVEAAGSAPESGSPKRQQLQAPKPEQPKSPERPAPVFKPVGEKEVERLLMPPPPPPVFTAPAPPPPVLQCKRTRDLDAPVADQPTSAPSGDQEEIQSKKTKVCVDASGLVPYGADSSDEEEEKTQSSKT